MVERKDYFFPIVSGGEGFRLRSDYLTTHKDFRDMYYNAEYHWGIFNPQELMIVTYTEGDVTELRFSNKQQFVKELEKYKQFHKKYSGGVDQELTRYLAGVKAAKTKKRKQ